jgi:hypothetical protein
LIQAAENPIPAREDLLMKHLLRSTALHTTAATVATAGIVLGTLGFGATGVAATTPVSGTSTQQPTVRVNYGLKAVERRFNCAHAERVVTAVQRKEAKMAKARTNVEAQIAKAQTHHGPQLRAHLVHFWQQRLAKLLKYQSHMLRPKAVAKMNTMAKIAEDKCHVSAPPAVSGLTAPTVPLKVA